MFFFHSLLANKKISITNNKRTNESSGKCRISLVQSIPDFRVDLFWVQQQEGKKAIYTLKLDDWAQRSCSVWLHWKKTIRLDYYYYNSIFFIVFWLLFFLSSQTVSANSIICECWKRINYEFTVQVKTLRISQSDGNNGEMNLIFFALCSLTMQLVALMMMLHTENEKRKKCRDSVIYKCLVIGCVFACGSMKIHHCSHRTKYEK